VVKVLVSFGNGCQVCESYAIITVLRDLFRKHNVDGIIEIEEHHCSGKCIQGITLKIDGESINYASANKIPDIFTKKIMPKT
jgi:NADH:ubiquinone oxidoreductase subunit E